MSSLSVTRQSVWSVASAIRPHLHRLPVAKLIRFLVDFVADASTPAVSAADEAVHIGQGGAPSDTYNNIEAIIDAAKKTGAQAIHPG